MTNTQHTPGPWGVDATGQVCKRAANGSWDLIAYLDESPYYPDKFANAALIAAAPAMYEALRRIKVLMESGDIEGKDWIEYGQIVQALAQAEGKEL